MRKATLSGKTRKYTSFIEPFQKKLVDQWVPALPRFIETYHLTLFTLPLSMAVIFVGYLARQNIAWILLISPLILLQYISDILDGALGRYRNTGLVLWGFYMDHMMDYVFAGSLLAAYTLAYQLPSEFFLVACLVTSGIFIHEFLMCITEGKYNTSGYYGFGPTEIRVLLMAGNLLLPLLPKAMITGFLQVLLPVSCFLFILLIYRAHRYLWRMDMEYKKRNSSARDAQKREV